MSPSALSFFLFQRTLDGHLVEPAGLAHLIAHHALKLG